MVRTRAWPYFSLCSAAPLSVLAAVIHVSLNSGFGRGDLRSFAFWSALLIIPLLFGFRAFRPLISRLAFVPRAALGLILGALLGALFTVALAVGMGPVIGSFSFPILYIWAGSAGIACCLAAVIAPLQTPKPVSEDVLKWSLVVILSLGVVGSLPILLQLGSMYLWDRAEPEVYLLPVSYEGPVFVLFAQPQAPPLPIVDGRRELRVPKNGVLLTSSSIAEGWKNPAVYYVRQDGLRVPVHTDWARIDTTDGVIRTYWLSTRIGGMVNGVQQPTLRYEAFIVGARGSDSRLEERADFVLDSLWKVYAR